MYFILNVQYLNSKKREN